MTDQKQLSNSESEQLLTILEERFNNHMHRHEGLEWIKIADKLLAQPEKLWSLYQMEETGGEPDVIEYNEQTNEYIFYDCVKESPKGRRSACYDRAALESRKKHKPKHNVIDLVTNMGIELLAENEYRKLQSVVIVDEKTSSWIKTPEDISNKGGALFCNRRYGHVFVYHNGASSYYASRGFRGRLTV